MEMRPARDDEAEMLAHWKPMIIINQTLLGPAYVESLVSQSSVLITSITKGQKTIPVELWYMILDLIANDPEPHQHALVRPIDLKVDGKRNRRLVCVKVNRWRTMGALEYETEAIAAHGYLARPDLTFEDLDYPFKEVGKPSIHWEIPDRVFSSKYKAVYVAITVPNVIKYLEGGRCQICLGNHYADMPSHYDLRAIFCPLCVGPHISRESIRNVGAEWILDE